MIDCLTKACVQKTELDDLLLKSGLFKNTIERLDICIASNSTKENTYLDKLKLVSDQIASVNTHIDAHNLKIKNDMKAVVNLEQF